MLKGKRTITLAVELTVDIGDIEFTYDEYSSYLHDQGVRKSHAARVLKEVQAAVGEDVTVASKHSSMDIVMDAESNAEFERQSKAEWNRWEAEQDAIREVGEALRIKEVIYSMGNNEKLLANEPFTDQVCRFVYERGWDDDETLVDDQTFDKPTYQQVWQAADRLVQRSNDKHHVFVEGVEDKGVDSEGVRTLAFYYGS